MNTKRVTAAGIIAAGKNEKKKMLPGKDLLLLNLWNCAEREKKREEEEEMEEEKEGLHRRRPDLPRRRSSSRFERVAGAAAAGVGGATAMEFC